MLIDVTGCFVGGDHGHRLNRGHSIMRGNFGDGKQRVANDNPATKKTFAVSRYAVLKKPSKPCKPSGAQARTSRIIGIKPVKETDAFLKKILHKYLKCMNTDEQHRLVRYLHLSDNRLNMSSSCSGSGLALIIMHWYADMLGATLEHVFSCEKVNWKQDWIRDIVEAYVYGDQSLSLIHI